MDVCADFTFSPAAILDLGGFEGAFWNGIGLAVTPHAMFGVAEWARRDRTTGACSLHGSFVCRRARMGGVHDAYR